MVNLVRHDVVDGLYIPIEKTRVDDKDIKYVIGVAVSLDIPCITEKSPHFDPTSHSLIPGAITNNRIHWLQCRIPSVDGPSMRQFYRLGDSVLVAWRHNEHWLVRFSLGRVTKDEHGPFISVFHDAVCSVAQKVPRNCIYMSDWELLHDKCREAVYCWLLSYKHLGLYRDMGVLIGKFIWELRDEREWKSPRDYRGLSVKQLFGHRPIMRARDAHMK